jgi:hypothetical protein
VNQDKKCSECGVIGDALRDFNKRQSKCKPCQSAYKKVHYNKNNKDKRRKYLDKNAVELAAKSKVYKKKYYKENKVVLNELSLKNYIKNRDHIIAHTYEWKKKRLKTDPMFKLVNNISSLIRVSMNKLKVWIWIISFQFHQLKMKNK